MKEIIATFGTELKILRVIKAGDDNYVVADYYGAILDKFTTEGKAMARMKKLGEEAEAK